jgi:hypothetical protein
MNILYLGDINSVHDFKWCSFFGVKSGFNVYFLTEEENYKRMSSECKIRFKESNINILPPIGYFSIKNPISSLISIVKLNSYLKEYQINIFHVLLGSPQPIWFLFTPNKVKNVVTTRGSDVLVLLKQVMNEASIKNRILKRLLIAGLCKADYISATSSQQIEFLIECGVAKDKIKLIKTGVDIDRVQIQSKNDSLSTKKEKFIFSARPPLLKRNISPICFAITLLLAISGLVSSPNLHITASKTPEHLVPTYTISALSFFQFGVLLICVASVEISLATARFEIKNKSRSRNFFI